jgi:FMN phosphatase YigB (HAD superfamily)
MVGDSEEADVAGAEAVGIHGILLARGGEPASHGAIRSLAALPSLI